MTKYLKYKTNITKKLFASRRQRRATCSGGWSSPWRVSACSTTTLSGRPWARSVVGSLNEILGNGRIYFDNPQRKSILSSLSELFACNVFLQISAQIVSHWLLDYKVKVKRKLKYCNL